MGVNPWPPWVQTHGHHGCKPMATVGKTCAIGAAQPTDTVCVTPRSKYHAIHIYIVSVGSHPRLCYATATRFQYCFPYFRGLRARLFPWVMRTIVSVGYAHDVRSTHGCVMSPRCGSRGFTPTAVLCHRDAVHVGCTHGCRGFTPTVAVGSHPRLCYVTATRFMWVAPTDMFTSPRWGSNRHSPFSSDGFKYQRFAVALQLANQRLLLRNDTVNRRTFFVKI